MIKKDLVCAMEAAIFASGEPLKTEQLSRSLDISPEDTEEALGIIAQRFNSDESGIRLIRIKDAVQFCSDKKYVSEVRKVLELTRNTPLSPAAMEVLSLVAYNEPVTKAYVEQVRGVDCSGVISNLINRELIEERGRLELPGRPLVYGVTDNFYRCFGISSLEELPPIEAENTEKQ